MLAAVLDLHLSKVDPSCTRYEYVDNILSGCNTEDESSLLQIVS